MEYKLKTISPAGIGEALSKVELYRYLNEPGEAESICRDILSVDPEHQAALRLLGLAITDQFTGAPTDRSSEAEKCFHSLTDPYQRHYYNGVLCERMGKAQLLAGRSPHTVLPLLEEAMRSYEEAEKIRPPGNDAAILRWNRCVRLLQSRPAGDWERAVIFDTGDSPPVTGKKQ